jgi:predicted alpha/beta superfamily hydrolase
MKISSRTMFLAILLLVQALHACASQAPATQAPVIEQSPEPASQTLVRVTLPNSEVRQLHSSATGRDYDLYIRLPEEYLQDQETKYPILYVLDGQWDFKLLDSIYTGLRYDGFVPATIIVGITYSGEDADYVALRATDYTPVYDVFFPGTGGGSRFLAFFKQELMPFVESEYRADPAQRVLMGSSFGGTFTLYTLFSEPGLFRAFVAGSPIVTFGNGHVFQQEADYAEGHKELPVRLYIGVGELEDEAGPVEEFMQVLRGRNYTGLELETRIVEGERHAGNKPEVYNRGLRFVFQEE